ncbi:MAG: hypothetical protein ABSB80_08520 [Methanoregula sp.]|uniref:hypothetical protein n=1 Tax=Methanoregula sp. TaxID=2052170 RepID=UPI003D13351F
MEKSSVSVVNAPGDVDITGSWRQEKNASAFFESQETALPEGRTRRVLRLSAVQDFPMKIFSTAFGCPRRKCNPHIAMAHWRLSKTFEKWGIKRGGQGETALPERKSRLKKNCQSSSIFEEIHQNFEDKKNPEAFFDLSNLKRDETVEERGGILRAERGGHLTP